MTPHRATSLYLTLALLLTWMPAGQALEADTRWQDAQRTLLDVDFPDTGFHGRWEFFNCDCGDILLRLEQTAPDGVTTGELALVDGQVLLARGAISAVRDLEPMMQAPALMLHLALALMNRALPEGPAVVPPPRAFDEKEPRLPLEINSGMATGSFRPPWGVTGKAWRAGPEKRRVDLDFEFANPMPGDEDNTDRMVFNVALQFDGDAYPLDAAATLDGWMVQWLSRGETESQPADPELTWGDLRARALAPVAETD